MKKLIHYYNAKIRVERAFQQGNVVNGGKPVVKMDFGGIGDAREFPDQEFMAEMMNSLKSFDIGMAVLLIIISLELIASIWSTLTM